MATGSVTGSLRLRAFLFPLGAPAPCRSTYAEINLSARSYHAGGVNVLFADGSGRFVADGIAPATWTGLGTRAGGEPVSGDY